jgi:glyoxylase-like metal-dependent hydrolase (beta-lactamase superfamily II)
MQDTGVALVPNGGWDARIRRFRAGEEVDTYAVVTARYVVLVDTLATPEQAAAALDMLRADLGGRQIGRLLVVNTHADYDHAWGNALFAAGGGTTPSGPLPAGGPLPAPIIGHRLAAERLRGSEARQELAERQARDPRFRSVRLVPPDITCDGALTIDGGDLALELLPTPGHTPDHVAVWIPAIRTLLAGDAAEHPFPYVPDAAALPVLRASLRRLRELDPAVVLPCHGGTHDPTLLDRNLAYFDALERAVRQARANGALPADWEMRADLPDLVGFPYDMAVQMAGADSEAVPAFYRDFHLQAVRVMAQAVGAEQVG